VGVLFSTGSGFEHRLWQAGMKSATANDPTPSCMPTLLTGDIDGDGRGDVVINKDENKSVAQLLVSRPSGNHWELIGAPVYTIIDLNGDGRDDIVLLNNKYMGDYNT
ncbi:MAG: hypothetical protein ACRERC_06050, partial [Candidatus Binatia bacterium]